MVTFLTVYGIVLLLACCVLTVKSAGNNDVGAGLSTLVGCAFFAFLSFFVNKMGSWVLALFLLIAMPIFLAAMWEGIVPEKTSSDDSKIVIGYIRRFKSVSYYEGPARPFNNWWVRVLGLSNFESGFIVNNFKRSIDGGGTITGRYVIRTYESFSYEGFKLGAKMIPNQLHETITDLLRREASANEVADELANVWKKWPLVLELQKVDYYENRPSNLMTVITEKMV